MSLYNSAFTCAILASATSILAGIDNGATEAVSKNMVVYFNVSDKKAINYFIVLIFVYTIGSLAAGKTSDWIGRRWTLLFSLFIFFLGSLLTSLATNFPTFISGRFFISLSVGGLHTVAPVYITEISPNRSRGFHVCFLEVFMNIGVLIGTILSFAFAKLPDHLSWRFVSSIGTMPSFVLAFAHVLAVSESPSWLVLRGRISDAKRVLVKTSASEEEAQLRLRQIIFAAGESKRRRRRGLWREIVHRPSPSLRRALIAAVGINFFQKTVGIDAVKIYSDRILSMAGVNSRSNILVAITAVRFIMICVILVAAFLIDRIGRRPLVLISVAGLIPSLAGLGLGLTVFHSDDRLMWAIALAMVLLSNAFFSIGLGPITWVYSSEIFPLRFRAQGTSIGAAVNCATGGGVSMSFISVYRTVTIGGYFVVFAGISMVAWVYFYMLLPETRGKNFEEMEDLFGNGNNGEDCDEGEVAMVSGRVMQEGGRSGVVELPLQEEHVAKSERWCEGMSEVSAIDCDALTCPIRTTLQRSATFPVFCPMKHGHGHRYVDIDTLTW